METQRLLRKPVSSQRGTQASGTPTSASVRPCPECHGGSEEHFYQSGEPAGGNLQGLGIDRHLPLTRFVDSFHVHTVATGKAI